MAENGICKLHSGFEAKIESLEDNVSKLWQKWDKIMLLLVVNLVAVVGILIKVIIF